MAVGTSGNAGKGSNPATGEQQAEVALASVTEVDAVVAAAKTAFATWRSSNLSKRAEVMFRMRELVDAGFDVSAGVLNALDTDEKTGCELGLSMAVEAPFSPVGDEADEDNRRLIRRADLVVVAPVPVSVRFSRFAPRV